MTLSFVRRLPLLAASLLAQVCLFFPHMAHADNPVVQHIYSADPAPMVNGDTVYLCTSHDEDVTKDNFFTMNDWRVFSTKDMVNWTDHGSPLSYRTFTWATGKAWAPHCIARGGKFYMYVPVSDAIGVAVADSPTGPFKDAIGKPLLSNYQYIDPTVFIDSDGQAYLYFGNPKLWYVKLNSDMISYSGQVQAVNMTTESFGQRSGVADRPTLYEEGPWFYKRNDLYYMMFAMGPLPEKIGYSTSSSATGPWSYKGVIMNNQSGHAFTNHSGVIDFKGHSYFFYHTQELAGGGGYKRSVAVEEFTYKADGSFPAITKTSGGVTQSAAPLNPYERVEGETIAWAPNVEIEDCRDGGRNVTSIENNDSIKVESVNFLTGAVSFSARVAAAGAGGSIELHLDSASGNLLGTCAVPNTGGAQEWQTVNCTVSGATGTKDLVLVFKGGSGSLFNLDSWQFTPKDPLPSGSGGSGGGGGSAGTAGGGTSSTAGAASGGATPGGGGASSLGGGTQSSGAGGSTSSGGTSSAGVSAGGGIRSTTGGSASSSGGTGGTSASAGTPASTPEDGGCTCSAAGDHGISQSWAVSLVGALLTAAQLRRSRRRAAKER
jgi:arabinoxylan arabinofuranohydrolase